MVRWTFWRAISYSMDYATLIPLSTLSTNMIGSNDNNKICKWLTKYGSSVLDMSVHRTENDSDENAAPPSRIYDYIWKEKTEKIFVVPGL